MKKPRLDDTNVHIASRFIREQMATQSWWPREQPHLAREEFLRMQGSPELLSAWCEKWLYSAQMRQLKKYLAQDAAEDDESQ